MLTPQFFREQTTTAFLTCYYYTNDFRRLGFAPKPFVW